MKSGKHFNASESLDNLPLTHPEHFGTPVSLFLFLTNLRVAKVIDIFEHSNFSGTYRYRYLFFKKNIVPVPVNFQFVLNFEICVFIYFFNLCLNMKSSNTF